MFIPGAVFVVTNQRKAPGGELDTDLMTATGVKPDVDQGGFSCGEPLKLQTCLFDTGADPFDNEHFVFLAVLPEKIFPVTVLWRDPVDLSNVFLDHGPFLYGF